MKPFSIVLAIIGTAFLCATNLNAEIDNTGELPPSELIEALKRGNHIIYVRHGMTDRSGFDREKTAIDINRCETQRNLSPEGKAQVQRLGGIIAALEIPIGTVKTSPYCRTKDTAKAIFGRYEVDDDLRFSIGLPSEESQNLGQHLFDSMLSITDVEKNTVYVGHTANLKDGLGVWPKPEGVMVVFKKSGDKIVFMGMIEPEEWVKPEDS